MDSDSSLPVIIFGFILGLIAFLAQLQLFNISNSLKQLVTTGHLILEELKKQRGPQ